MGGRRYIRREERGRGHWVFVEREAIKAVC